MKAGPIFWTNDFAAAAAVRTPSVLLLDLDDASVQPLTRLLPTAADLLHAQNYGEARRYYFFARRAVLRHLIACRLGCDVEAVVVEPDRAGAPRLASPISDATLHLSVTRRGALAALAIAPGPIGVDLEIFGVPEAVPTAVLHVDEVARLAGLSLAARHKRFLEIWTLKEAYLKALGIGLLREPTEVEVRFEAGRIFLVDRGQPMPMAACETREETVGAEAIIAACVML